VECEGTPYVEWDKLTSHGASVETLGARLLAISELKFLMSLLPNGNLTEVFEVAAK